MQSLDTKAIAETYAVESLESYHKIHIALIYYKITTGLFVALNLVVYTMFLIENEPTDAHGFGWKIWLLFYFHPIIVYLTSIAVLYTIFQKTSKLSLQLITNFQLLNFSGPSNTFSHL